MAEAKRNDLFRQLLRGREELFLSLLDATPEAVIVVDERMHIIFWNKGAEAIYGYTEDEILGENAVILLPQRKRRSEQGRFDESLQSAASAKLGKTFASVGVRKSGEEFSAEVSQSILTADNQNYFIGVVRDVSERMRLESVAAQSTQRLRLLLENSTDLIITVDSSGTLQYVSPASEQILGRTSKEVLDQNVLELIHPDDHKTVLTALGSALQNPGSIHNASCRCLHKDGSWRTLHGVGRAAADEAGQLLIVITARDITEQKNAEDARRESEERFSALATSASDPIICIDSSAAVIFWNAAAEAVFGYTAAEMMGNSLTRIIPERYQEYMQGGLERVVSSGVFDIGGIAFEFTGLRKSGAEFPAEMSFSSWKSGSDVFFSCIVRDISERRITEESLQREKDFTQTIIETADVIIIALDLEDQVILFNRKAEEVTGYSRDEVLGKELLKTIPVRMDREAFDKMSREISGGAAVSPYHQFITTKNGEEKIILTRGTQLKNTEGRVIGVLETGVDVTEQRSMETKLLQAEKLRDLGELAGGVAHDFNNVLAAILGRAQLLRMHLEEFAGSERRKAYHELQQGLEVIERAAADGAETVRRIQEFARIRPDDKDAVAVDINEVVAHAMDFTRVRWKDNAELKGIHFTIVKQLSEVPLILGSPAELREVLTNLINNSLDAMPGGGTIRVETFKEHTHVCLRLTDTGGGMPPHVVERIFDPFFTTKGPQSTGLGMSVSYGIITRHQGTIAVESREGSGTVFTIKFPLKEIEKASREEPAPAVRDADKASILVIDDEEDVRELLCDILTMHGHEVTAARDGRQGLEIFASRAFDMVFTDLGMPGMSGWEVATAVKKIAPDAAVALITGWGIQLEKEDMEKSSVDHILNKPFTVEDIVRLVHEALAHKNPFPPFPVKT
jgi:PAS domain S-box-containing protein